MSNQLKICSKCGEEKPITEFSRDCYKFDRLRYVCKSCDVLRIIDYRKKQQPLYHIWQAMLRRCENYINRDYLNYGGRGIKVCIEWYRYKNFERDMLPTYRPGLILDRIDNDGDYERSNCRWVTPKESNRNKRNTIKVFAFGKERVLVELAEEYGINQSTVKSRLRRAWSIEKALTTKVRKMK
jgi:hypothetical protein